MVEVIYKGRFGNNIFQYCFGRILAENLGFKLKADAIPGFPNTATPVEGYDYSDYPTQIITGQTVDLEGVLKDKSKRKIVLDGFFQKYEYYKPYKNLIKNNWLLMDVQSKECVMPDDIIVYVRRGDVIREGIALPFSYYHECLKNTHYDRVFLCTDDSRDPFIFLFKRYKAIIHHSKNNYLNDFRFMMAFNKIIQSASSFSWWAAFLSNAKEIYCPISLNGHWSEGSEVNLTVDDETRYTYIKCKEMYKLTVRDKLINLWDNKYSIMRRTCRKIIGI